MHCARPAQRGAPSGLWGPGGRIPEAIIMKSVTSLTLTAALLAMPAGLYAAAPDAAASTQSVLEIDFKVPTTPVSPILHGLMTEEINYSYDGGLYAELIRNRVAAQDRDLPVTVIELTLDQPVEAGRIIGGAKARNACLSESGAVLSGDAGTHH